MTFVVVADVVVASTEEEEVAAPSQMTEIVSPARTQARRLSDGTFLDELAHSRLKVC